MAVKAEVGTLSSPAIPGVQTYNHSLGKAPKAIVLWSTSQTANGVTGDALFAIGFATSSTNRGCVASNYRDGGSDLTEDRRHDNTLLIVTLSSAGAVVEEADLDGFTSTQFSLDWETTVAAANEYNYLLLAGDDLEANVVSFVANTSPGNQNVAHGLSAAPTGILAISAHNLGGVGTNDGAGEAGMSVGGSDVTDDRVSSTFGGSFVGGNRYQIAKFLTHAQSGAVVEEANVDSVDGTNVVVDWDLADSAEYYYLLCLKGCTMKCGSYTSTAGGNTAIATGLTSVAAFLTWGCMAAASASNETDGRLTFGASDGSNNAGGGWLIDNLDVNADRFQANDKCLAVYDHAQALQEDGTATFSGGTVTVAFSGSAGGNEFHYLAIEAESSTAEPPTDLYFASPGTGIDVEVETWKPA